MAIADDFSVAVNGDIRHTSGTDTYTVLELHRFLQNLADDASASGNDLVDITSDTPSDRSTDNIITLLGSYNLDDTAAEFLFAGSISQLAGATVYSGLQVLGAVNNGDTQLIIVQDSALYDGASPFWGTQSAGGLNGNAAVGILMRCLVKTRVSGADIDGQRVRVQARHWGDTYDFFNVTLGAGESVAAVSTTPDAQNTTSQGTVTSYTHIANSGGTANAPTGGFQTINLENGNGARPFYSQWTFGANTSSNGLRGVWEYIKDLSGNGTSKTIDGLNGEFFLGVTHSFAYDGETANFNEREIVAWGTSFGYDSESSGPFSLGEYVTIGSSGAAGKLVYLQDDGSDGVMAVALEETSISLADNDVITGITSGATAAIDAAGGAITNNGTNGGTGLLLGYDDDGGTGNMYIQLLSGNAPINDLPIYGPSAGSDGRNVVNGAASAKTIPKIYLGSYTGTLIGAYGIGVDADDLTASDTVEDLLGATQTPPNNVVFTVSGLVSGEDRVLVGPRAAGVLEKDQDTSAGSLTDNATSSLVMTTAIATDTPTTGTVRIQDDNGIFVSTAYDSYSSSTYALSANFQGSNNADASSGNDVFVSYIDELAGSSTATFTAVYNTDRDLFVRVRDGGGTPIKTFEAPATLGSTGGSVAAIRTTDA